MSFIFPLLSRPELFDAVYRKISESGGQFMTVTEQVGRELKAVFFFSVEVEGEPSNRGFQPFGISGPHWKTCLEPHIEYIATCNNKKFS